MVLVVMLNDSTMLRHNGFIDLGILPEDGCPKGPGKNGWSDRGRRKDREGDGGRTWDQMGLTGSTDPLQPSLSFRRPHQLLGWSQRHCPCSPTAERDVVMAKGTTRKERTRAPGWAVGPAATYRVGAEASGLQNPHTPGAEPSPNRQRRACHCLLRSSASVAGVAASFSPSALTARAAKPPIWTVERRDEHGNSES